MTNILASLITKVGLTETLSGVGPLTIFAPNDASLLTLDPAIGADSAQLKRILSYHIVESGLPLSTLTNEFTPISLAGPKARVNIYGKVYRS